MRYPDAQPRGFQRPLEKDTRYSVPVHGIPQYRQSTHISPSKSVAEVDIAGNGNRSVGVHVATDRPADSLIIMQCVFHGVG